MHRAAVLALVLVSFPATASSLARAQEPQPADEKPPGRPAEAPAQERSGGAKKPSLEFDLLPPKPKAAPADARLAREVVRRRHMLTLHQGFGMATWAALAATTVVGQLDLNDRFRGGGDTGRFHPWHKGLAYGTSALFLSTGLLAVLAPVPYPKRIGLDTATLHKASMAVATAGMIAQVVLGTLARHDAGSLGERGLARAHQAVGYATLSAMSVGWAVLLF